MVKNMSFLEKAITNTFNSRVIADSKGHNKTSNIALNTKIEDNTLWVLITDNENNVHSLSIPCSYMEKGIELITVNDVTRVVCNVFMREDDEVWSYNDVMYNLLCENTLLTPNRTYSNLRAIIYSLKNNNTSVIIHKVQSQINAFINQLPLYETDMNAYITNKRLIIIDENFSIITDPTKKLQYQVDKNIEYFDRGWTSIGMSDGTLADKNYILTEDLKKYTPFGIKHHNPKRNLYSSLKMKGDELPIVRTESMQKLIDKGVSRKGWNLFTLFTDIPDVWEDQIMVDNSILNKYITHTKRFQCYGELLINVGDSVYDGYVLSASKSNGETRFDMPCDSAHVIDINKSYTNTGGIPTRVYNVTVEYKRQVKEGCKFNNMSANKGIIRVRDLGYAVDPRTGEQRKIDVIVSAKSVMKRKNFPQLLEAMFNNVNDERVTIIPDNAFAEEYNIAEKLAEKGFPKDGTWMCHTYEGEIQGICGTVFWGVTHDAESTIWKRNHTTNRNGRGLRTSGLKFSPIEFRSMITMFGENNAMIREIMQYNQGTTDLKELIKVLHSKKGESITSVPRVNWSTIKPVDQSSGTIIPMSLIVNTYMDKNIYPNGFTLELPVKYQVCISGNGECIQEGVPVLNNDNDIAKEILIDSIYVPYSGLIEPWKHPNGNWGLSEIGTCINNILVHAHRAKESPENEHHTDLLYSALYTYFNIVAKMVSGKSGVLNTLGMSVRYPLSIKGVATLSNVLPDNTVEIHSSMAKTLKVETGDIVLVERFPCLGCMSLRLQKVKVTEDDRCRYTIRTSNNCLKSTNVDFDGDTLFIASFHSEDTKALMYENFYNPAKAPTEMIDFLNNKAGKPQKLEMNLKDYAISKFDSLNTDTHAEIVKALTGVKSHTGPVIALTYNIMRIVERAKIKDQDLSCGIEFFLDKVANSIFDQKHGEVPLHDIVTNAVCSANVSTLTREGFDREVSEKLCNIIEREASYIGIHDLEGYHEYVKENGGSNIINLLVRKNNRIYFASRASMEGCALLEALNKPVVDIPSKVFEWTTTGKFNKVKTTLEDVVTNWNLKEINDDVFREIGKYMCNYTDLLFSGKLKKSLTEDINKIKGVNHE